MPILLPNLDDRRWADLVDEGRALIPLYAPEWTDHNVHDPGITLVELFAALAEMDIFRLNRISDASKLKFLALVGIYPAPPRASSTVLAFRITGGNSIALPEGVEASGKDPFGAVTPFRTLTAINVVPASLAAVQVKDAGGFHDLTDRWRRGLPFGVFGDIPAPGAELYLGFDKPLAKGEAFSLHFTLAGARAGAEERRRIIAEAAARRDDCRPPALDCKGVRSQAAPRPAEAPYLPPFSAVRLVWELLVAPGVWARLGAKAVEDDTRAFTLSGGIVIAPTADSAAASAGKAPAPLHYIRVRFEAGAYDAPPIIENLTMNAVQAEQAVSVGKLAWVIAKGAVTSPPAPPAPETGLRFTTDSAGEIVSLTFVTDPTVPQFRILEFTAATAAAAGRVAVEAVWLGTGDGTPYQVMPLPQAEARQCGFELFSVEAGEWRRWRLRRDFDASDRADRDFLLDATAATVIFGSGDKGLALPAGAHVIAKYMATRAEAGNLRAGAIAELVDSPHNRALFADFADVKKRLVIANPIPAAGGAEAETPAHATGRAMAALTAPQRAISVQDYETLAKETPGVRVGRVKAWPDHHPAFPCCKAPGVVTVVVLPDMPAPRPEPSAALRAAVAAYLNRRRIVGSRIIIAGPRYREVEVKARVQSLPGSSKTALAQRIASAIDSFLDPLTGGPDSAGWPFGRDVYRAEILQVIDAVAGVDYVIELALFADGCECSPECGNVCLAPTWLAASGTHRIEVI